MRDAARIALRRAIAKITGYNASGYFSQMKAVITSILTTLRTYSRDGARHDTCRRAADAGATAARATLQKCRRRRAHLLTTAYRDRLPPPSWFNHFAAPDYDDDDARASTYRRALSSIAILRAS